MRRRSRRKQPETARRKKVETAMATRKTRYQVPTLCHMLAPKDSNLDKQIQSLSCYRYTRGQRGTDESSRAADHVKKAA